MSIMWKIIVVILVLIQTSIGAFLGWRVLALMKRVKQIQDDRNIAIEQRNNLIVQRQKNFALSELEKKMILAALNMPEYGKEIKDPKTTFQVRKTYRNLKEKIKDSFND